MRLAMEAIASEATSLRHCSEDWLQKISSVLGGMGDEMHKASVDVWNRMEESRLTALKEAQLTAAQREQCMKERVCSSVTLSPSDRWVPYFSITSSTYIHIYITNVQIVYVFTHVHT